MRISKRLAGVLGAAAAVALAIGCSKSSTGPSDPFVGSWVVTWGTLQANTALTPAPFTITIAKSGTAYTASYPNLTWAYTNGGGPIDTWSAASDSASFLIRGDSLYLIARDVNSPGCYLSVKGPISGNAAQGIVGAGGVLCVSGSWTWSATKQ